LNLRIYVLACAPALLARDLVTRLLHKVFLFALIPVASHKGKTGKDERKPKGFRLTGEPVFHYKHMAIHDPLREKGTL